MASDNEQEHQEQQDQHSIMNGRFKANPKEAKFFLEIVDKLAMQFNGIPVEDIIQTFWGEPRDVLEKLIKKANKREKKEEAKFDPKTLKRAPTANILFQKDYKAKCDSKGVKFDLKTCSEEYKKLSEKDKAKYQKEAQRLKEEYNTEYARLKAEAVKNGDFPEEKPKRPLSGFLRYLADVREEISEKYKDVDDRKGVNAKISKDAGEMWNALTDKQKAPYETAYKKDKEAFEIKLKEWENKELARRKKNGDPDVPVNIETAGTKKPAPKAEAPKAEEAQTDDTKSKSKATKAKPVASSASDSEDQEAEQPKPAKATKASTKASAKAKPVIAESENENNTEGEEVVEVKPVKAKTATKAK